MARPPLDPEIKREILTSLAAGNTTRDIARALKGVVSHATIARVAKVWRSEKASATISARAAALAARVPAAPAAPAAPDHDEDDTTPTPEKLRKMIARLWRRADSAERAGNATQSTQLSRAATDAMSTLLRAERDSIDDADVLRISRKGIDAATRSVLERFRALQTRPILCAHCSRELSVRQGLAIGRDGAGTREDD